ncbi:Xenobiotic-transporting ATPase [Clostridium sp. DL-VIII]|uniref:ATP-binding cassette domain-containing protein n=1 Tax=Clostridium sp. DL-VIII TaxID=641107 RepID=UPI00023B07EB|nr:ABC transporter ATP-binding protein [Clostridium sp. DL-VIII]EHJ02164.1 Xenobiotic-transporting ATPase [Clostridium sp. DL-VIII]
MSDKLNFKQKLMLLRKAIYILLSASPIYLILIFGVSILTGLIAPINLLIWQKFLDVVVIMISQEKWLNIGIESLILLSIVTLLGYLLNGILQYIKQTYGDLLDLHITEMILKKSLKFSMEMFDDSDTYNHINMAISHTSQNCLSLLDSISECIYSIIKAIGVIVIIIQFDWKVVIVSVVSALPALYISLKTNTYWYNVFFERTEKFRLINYLKMILIKNENIKEIKLYGIGLKIVQIIKDNYLKFLKNDKKARKILLAKKVSAQGLDEIISTFLKVWILILSIESKCSLGTIVLYFNAQDNLKSSIIELSNQISVLHNSILYLRSLDVIEKTNIQADEINRRIDCKISCIEFQNVSFKYPQNQKFALKNINFKFEVGKTYSIVGLNGSGKTTLIKLLLKLYKPTLGKILIDGINLQEINDEEYYSNISAIFQDFIKYPFSIHDNIAVRGNKKKETYFSKAVNIAGIKDLIDGLPFKEETLLMKDWKYGTDISQGQWQKIAIARCCYCDSLICIFDEPFSSIDVEAENHIIQQINSNKKERLAIFITHRFSSISLADEIIVMKEGVILEQGKHMELVNNKGLYYELYSTQTDKLNKSVDNAC